MKKLLALLVTLGLLAACSAGQTSASKEASGREIVLGLTYVPDIQFAPFYVAEEKGFFAYEGLNIRLRHHGAQEALLGALASGEEEIVFAGGDEMLQGRAQGIDVVDWATMYQQYPAALLVRADSDITSLQDLRGKTIGLPGPYGENYFALEAMLAQTGMKADDDVSIQYIGYTQQAALATKKVDAVIGFSNSDAVSIAAAINPAKPVDEVVRTISLSEGTLPLVGVGLGSLTKNVDAHADDYTKILKAVNKAVTWSSEHPEETIKLSAKYAKDLANPAKATTAQAVLERTLKLYQGSGTLGSQAAQPWSQMSEFMASIGLLEGNEGTAPLPVTPEASARDLSKEAGL